MFFGLACGIATGITTAIELRRASLDQDHYPLRWEAVFSAIRGVAFGLALYWVVGLPYAATFAALVTAGQIVAYSRGKRPGLDYSAARRARVTRRQLWGVAFRTVGYLATALICGTVVRPVAHAWLFATRVGVVTGLVTAVGTMVNPYIEYYADNLPERRLGVFGIWLVLLGFGLQSVQYWMAILDIPVG